MGAAQVARGASHHKTTSFVSIPRLLCFVPLSCETYQCRSFCTLVTPPGSHLLYQISMPVLASHKLTPPGIACTSGRDGRAIAPRQGVSHAQALDRSSSRLGLGQLLAARSQRHCLPSPLSTPRSRADLRCQAGEGGEPAGAVQQLVASPLYRWWLQGEAAWRPGRQPVWGWHTSATSVALLPPQFQMGLWSQAGLKGCTPAPPPPLRAGAVFLVLFMMIDAGYSGDWSRIGAISKDTEAQLQQVGCGSPVGRLQSPCRRPSRGAGPLRCFWVMDP